MGEEASDASTRPDHVDGMRAMFFALLGVAGVRALGVTLGDRPGHPGLRSEVFAFLQQAIFLAAPLLYARGAGLRPFVASGFSRLPLRKALLIFLASLGTMWLLQGLSLAQPIVFRWLGLEEAGREELETLERGFEVAKSEGLLFPILVYVMASPLCEETLFRGLVFRGFVRRFGPGMSLLFTSLLFAIMHGTMIQLVIMFGLGLYFGFLVHLTGSLWAGILAHALNNAAVLLLSATFGNRLMSLRGPWLMYPLSAIVLGGALVLLALDRPGEKPTSTG
jgi:membrane protease YdiL (CAAX protease family)